jgi:hypothetical protein
MFLGFRTMKQGGGIVVIGLNNIFDNQCIIYIVNHYASIASVLAYNMIYQNTMVGNSLNQWW